MPEPVGKGTVVVTPDFSKFESAVRSFSSRAAGAMGSLTAAVTGVGLSGLVAFGLKSAASLEQAQVGFETLLGSGKKAQVFLQQLQSFAAKTPFELPGLIDASRTLLGVGVSARDVIPMLDAFGNAAGAVGVGQEAFQRIMLATSQAISAGRFQTADLNQITANGIPIWGVLSRAMHKPIPELRDLASHGKLLSKDVLPVLEKQMQKDYGGAMAKQSQTLAGVWSTLKDSVAIGLANAIKPLVPLLTQLVPKAAAAATSALSVLTTGVGALIASYRSGSAGSATGFLGAMQKIGAFARDATPVIIHLAQVAGTVLKNAYAALAPVVIATVRFFTQHRTIAIALASTIAALVVVTKAHAAVLAVQAAGGLIKYIASLNIVTAVTKVWTAVQWALNVALDANPIGIVVIALAALVGGLILAWKHSETFRSIVIGAWNGIKAAVSAVGGWFAGTLWPWIKRVWDNIANASLWLWHTILEPAWRGIQRVIHDASAVIQLAVAILVAYFRNVVAPMYLWLWHTIIQPVWNGIRAVIDNQVKLIRAIVAALMTFFRNNVAPVLMWLWRNVVNPVMQGWRTATQGMWNFVRPILTALGNFVRGTLVNQFKAGVAGIRAAWDGLKAAAKAPVAFVVNAVINPLIGGFNKLAKIFHTPTVDPIPGFAEGGRIPGAPSSRDNRLAWLKDKAGRAVGTLAVATGEFIVNARDTAKALPLLRWINAGMKGGPYEAARRIGRPPVREPGDGSEGWAFAKGGLVGFLSDVWGVISNPAKAIKKPLEDAMGRIPGGGLIRDFLIGMGHRLIDGFVGWVSGTGTAGAAPGSVGKAQRFLSAQNGKPYIWASAGPNGYDCSGIVSAVYNILKGKNPYNHTFSTANAGDYFRKPGPGGPLIAAWSHPGQKPASASVGHMMGMVGGLTFESTGSRGVHLGSTTRRLTDFAHIGHFDHGGLVRLAKIARADFGAVTLAQGHNLIYNGTGKPEPLQTPPAGGAPGGRLHPDDIAALADAIGGVMLTALVGTVPATVIAARRAGRRPR